MILHRIEVHMKSEKRFRELMEEEGYHVPLEPHSSSFYPKYAFLIRASAEERFLFLRPEILPPLRNKT